MNFGKALQEWWDSDACKELQKANKEAKERAVGKYFMLSEEDKLDMVQAICYIMCKAESEGTSHIVVLRCSGNLSCWILDRSSDGLYIMLSGLTIMTKKRTRIER
jgi:hypothetical protein